MRRQMGFISVCIAQCAPGAEFFRLGRLDPRQEQWSEVVMKSLETKLLADGRVIDTKGEFVRYRVKQVKGNWLWLVADCGRRGWCHNRDVIQVDQAIVFFSAAITREPESARAYRMRGLAHYDALEYRRAIRDADTAIRIDPKFAPAYVDRCYAKLQKSDTKSALADANEAIRLDPKSARAYGAGPPSGRRRGSTRRPSRTTMRPSGSTPTIGMLLVYRSQCFSRQEDHDRAIADSSEAIRLEPTLTWAYLVRSKYWGRKNDFDREIEGCQRRSRNESRVAIRLPRSRIRLVAHRQFQPRRWPIAIRQFDSIPRTR